MDDTPENLIASDNEDFAAQAAKPVEEPQTASEKVVDAQARARREDRRQTLGHAIWLTVAIIVPLIIVFLTSRDEKITALYHGFRLGLTSFFIALAILGLSQIDKKVLGARFDSKAQVLASLLGVMLWLVWVGSGQMVYKAVDEAKAGAMVDYNVPND
jgi:hypothetical protein